MEAVLHGPMGRIDLGTSVLTIGRVPGSDIFMTDSQSSGRHAEIRPEGMGYSIVDLSSTNGTFVNDQRLTAQIPRPLRSGDRIRIGKTVFTYETSGISPIAPTVFAGQPVLETERVLPPTVAVPQPAYGKRQQHEYQPVPPQPQGYTVPATPFNPVTPQQKPKKSHRGLWVTLILLIVVVLLAGAAYAAFTYVNRSTPDKTLTAFCTDLKNNDYHGAYQQMSQNFQSRTSEAAFTKFFQDNFARAGGLKDCQFSNLATSGSTGTATITFTVNNGLIPPQPRSSTLVTDSGVWKIDSIAQK
jgi:predicted component of type VI protein secretion system